MKEERRRKLASNEPLFTFVVTSGPQFPVVSMCL